MTELHVVCPVAVLGVVNALELELLLQAQVPSARQGRIALKITNEATDTTTTADRLPMAWTTSCDVPPP